MAQTGRGSTEEIYRTLRQRICLLDLEPGERLPEVALAEEFGVSRTPIRQVLDRLKHERLVIQQPGLGATVAPLDPREIRDVWAVRLKLAELTGEFIHLPSPTGVIAELETIREELDNVRTSRDIRALGLLYSRYHDALLPLISSETLRRIHDLLYHQTERVWLQFLPEMDLDAEIDIMNDELDQTLDALANRDAARLADVRAKHLRMLVDRFNSHLARPLG
ncbi:MAG: GntR family transcriptional regulator [Nitriliruptorales bacterium]|nr:GntR family transcriptional regulator [Nitriliruptorales bacterium]